ncbi:MAG: TatD family hydrolase [Spirochaetes bacterium]|nr:TatD family hydrolase [Spirochaetota bacterium]
MYIDSHAHFDLCAEDHSTTADAIVVFMDEYNVGAAVHVVIDMHGLQWGIDFASKYNTIYLALGIHPSSPADSFALNKISEAVEHGIKIMPQKILGIGETGLDYYRMRQPKKMQQESFHAQIQLAKKYNLPVIVHSRDAMEDTYAILKEYTPLVGIIHCFSGDHADAKKFIDLGFYISFAGNVTYKTATTLQQAAQYVPLDRLLLETDAPFLTPVPFRGKPNHPGLVSYTYNFVSSLKKVSLSNCIDNIAQNFSNLLNTHKLAL